MKRSRPHALALFLAAINVILLMKPAALRRLSFKGTIDETIPLSSASSLGMRGPNNGILSPVTDGAS
jgi:hypothetical protein